jgi:hypothetical protein
MITSGTRRRMPTAVSPDLEDDDALRSRIIDQVGSDVQAVTDSRGDAFGS